MGSRNIARFAILALLAGAIGCGDDSGTTTPEADAGRADMGNLRRDAGPTDAGRADMGSPPPEDMGPPPPEDMGPPPPTDMGPPPPEDMGPPPPTDMGPPPADLGPPAEDMGPPDAAADSGPTDSGASDAGPAPDGGSGTAPASAGDLVITEIMYNPRAVADADGEWFELHNPSTATTFDLLGCVISELQMGGASMGRHSIGTSVLLPPGGYVVLARSDMAGVGALYSYGVDLSLNNSGMDEVRLTCGTTTIDVVTYDIGPMRWPSLNGVSLSLSPGALDATANDLPANWCASTSTSVSGDLGTPGSPNDACTP